MPNSGPGTATVDSLNKLGKSADSASKGVDKTAASSTDAAGKLFGISAIGFGLQGALGGLSTEADNVTKGFLEVTQGLTQATTTLFALQSLGIKPGFGIGVKKDGFGANLAKSGSAQRLAGIKAGTGKVGAIAATNAFGSRFAGGAKFGLGKVLSTFGRFVPLLGSAVIGFQVLNPILKKFGVDLGGLAGKFLTGLGQSLGVLDTPIQKITKSLKEFNDSLGDPFSQENKQQGGPLAKAILAERLAFRGKKLTGQESIAELQEKARIEKNKEVVERASSAIFSPDDDFAKSAGFRRKTAFEAIRGDSSDTSQFLKGLFTTGFDDLTKLVPSDGTTKGGAVVDEKKEREIKAALAQADLTIVNGIISRIPSEKLLDPKTGEAKSAKEIAKEVRNFIASLNDAQRNALIGSRDNFRESLAGLGVGNVDKSIFLSQAAKAIGVDAGSLKGGIESNLQNKEQKTLQLEILEIQRQSNIERAKAIASIKSQAQFALELKAASKESGEVEKASAAEAIRGLESQKKLSSELTDAFTKRVQSSEAIRRLSSATGSGETIVADYEKVNTLLRETNQKIRAGADFEGDIAESLKEQLISLDVKAGLAKKFVDSVTAESNAIKASSIVENARNELAKARLDILKAQTKEEERALKIRDRALASSRSSEDSQSRQADLDIEARRLALEGGNIGKGSRGSFSNSKAIANLGIEKAQNDAALALRNLIRSLQDELIRDVRSSGLSGADKRTLEKDITGAKTRAQIVSLTPKVESAIINADNKAAEDAKARETSALALMVREETAIDVLATATENFSSDLLAFGRFLSNPTQFFGDAAKSLFSKIKDRVQGRFEDGDGLLPQRAPADPVQEAESMSSSAANYNVRGDMMAEASREAREYTNSVVKDVELQEAAAAQKAAEAKAQAAERGAQADKRFADQDEENKKAIANATQQATNTTNALSAALTNFNNIARDAIQGLGDSLAQSQFTAFTSADPSQIQSAITNIQGVNVAKDALSQGDSNEDATRKQQEFIALESKRAEIRKTTSTATRVDLEFELEKTIKILALRNKFRDALKSGASNEDLQKIKTQIEAEEKLTQGIGDRLKKIGITGEEGIERLKESFAQGADQFIDSLSSGMVDAITKGESLGDVLRSAASDFASRMAKASLDNLFRQGAGALGSVFGSAPALAEGGMISGGSGTKDDVPAVLMGGEYVMKKSAVQKYGPNFMNALNQGNIQGYNQGGMVRTESGTQSSSWTPRSDRTEERDGYRKPSGDVRTESGLLASSWTKESSYLNAKKSELEKGLNYRSDSGVLISRWTPKSVYEGKEDFEREYFEEEDQEVRSESGIVVSKWTKEASQPNPAKQPSKSGRTESGLEASRWTVGASSENTTRIEKSPFVTGRVESGIPISRWNSQAQPEQATNTESFGKTIAVDFLNEIKQKSSKVVPDALSGSVPAMTMGGEFVLNKKSVDKYGPGFLDKVNQGAVQKFANGGLVQADIFGNKRDENFKYKRQTGKGGDFFAPGLYDSGNITGANDLLDFATQGFTSGKKDYISSPSAGAAVLALEPESVRLTNFGRNRNTPLQEATRDAKGQAFELNVGYQKDYFAYLKRREEEKKAKKAQRKAILTNLAMTFVSAGITSGINGASNAVKGAEALAKADGTVLSRLDKFKIGAKGFLGGGSLPGQTQSYGGLSNMFNERGGVSLNSNQYFKDNINTPFVQQYLDKRIGLGNIPKALQLEDNLNTYQGGVGTGTGVYPRATGGYIPNGTGIDDVPAMLTGGEFVLNSAATQRIGQGNLEAANAGTEQGVGGESSEELIEKMEELIDVTRENAGEINITVTGGSGNSNGGGGSSSEGREKTESSGAMEDNKKRQELAKQIKDKVLEVIREEKRLGGSLRS